MFLTLLSKRSAVTLLPDKAFALEKSPYREPSTRIWPGSAIDMVTCPTSSSGPIIAARNHHVIPM
jgi:hypothetical protein